LKNDDNSKMKKLKNITPGEILKEEFLVPMGISQYRLYICKLKMQVAWNGR